jgi:hypothetical protein
MALDQWEESSHCLKASFVPIICFDGDSWPKEKDGCCPGAACADIPPSPPICLLRGQHIESLEHSNRVFRAHCVYLGYLL